MKYAVAPGPSFRGASITGALAALMLHGVVVVALARVHPERWSSRPAPTVELEVLEPTPPPPPPAPAPPPEPEPPKPTPRPRPMVQALEKPPEPPKDTPPPPNEEPPEPPKETAPPVFGVTLDSTVTGDSAVAVPVGNTLATRDRTPAKPGPPPAPLAAASGPPTFSPVPEMYVEKVPVVLQEVKAPYPGEAGRLGVYGKVTLRVGIDRNGKVRSVKVIKKVGHGLDEAAAQALWRFRFTAAIAKDGRPVDIVITYNYSFEPR